MGSQGTCNVLIFALFSLAPFTQCPVVDRPMSQRRVLMAHVIQVLSEEINWTIQNMLYLQFIATCTLAILGTMIPLSAVHLYVPAWFRVTFDKTRVSSDWIIPGLEPFRKVHVIFGRGFPVELQNNLTSSASLAKVSWEIYTIDGGTENGEVTMRTRKSLNKPFWINSVL